MTRYADINDLEYNEECKMAAELEDDDIHDDHQSTTFNRKTHELTFLNALKFNLKSIRVLKNGTKEIFSVDSLYNYGSSHSGFEDYMTEILAVNYTDSERENLSFEMADLLLGEFFKPSNSKVGMEQISRDAVGKQFPCKRAAILLQNYCRYINRVEYDKIYEAANGESYGITIELGKQRDKFRVENQTLDYDVSKIVKVLSAIKAKKYEITNEQRLLDILEVADLSGAIAHPKLKPRNFLEYVKNSKLLQKHVLKQRQRAAGTTYARASSTKAKQKAIPMHSAKASRIEKAVVKEVPTPQKAVICDTPKSVEVIKVPPKEINLTVRDLAVCPMAMYEVSGLYLRNSEKVCIKYTATFIAICASHVREAFCHAIANKYKHIVYDENITVIEQFGVAKQDGITTMLIELKETKL